MAAGEDLQINYGTVQGMFLELADRAVATHFGDRIKAMDGTAWDRVAHNGTPYIPYPRGAEMLVVGHYDGDLRDLEQLHRATFLFPDQNRRLEIDSQAPEDWYEDYWYRGILKQARVVLEKPQAMGVQAFKEPKQLAFARSVIISCDVKTKKRYQEIPVLKEGI